MHIGIHATWDAYNCNADAISFVDKVEGVLHAITDTLDLKEVNGSFKQFEPIGVTGVILLEESHISIHTWPEHNYAAIDVFSCKAFDADLVTEIIKKELLSNQVETTILKRGSLEMVKNVQKVLR
ncbi:adenosylmethionine decarboxylase [Croceivirga sp. JEA036]|uniref:adenosylmethionine decarboxylase n=1 Tax=Croceivirga sp. JEA036 TaxID=2721162 RepID=UPI00143C27F2|nr:adenosylmethionine decarboxylase [Croceivirga sp. JEA036]NJB35012.1 adenosylmethionine decarboxylase [Croceivirga sp. JEA036]